MASVTALQLVNRVRLFRRQPEQDTFDSPEDVVTLNAVNMAIEDILSTRKWEFDLRTDGQLSLRKKFEDSLFNVFVADTAQATLVNVIAGLVDADVFGDYVVRVLPTDVTDYANTSLRINSASGVVGSSSFLNMETLFPTTVSGSGCDVFYSEYILPDTVKEVVRATYQEDPITLNQVDPVVRYSEIFPRPHDNYGAPEAIAVGGFDIPTYDSALDAPSPGLRMAVWPIPDEDYVINYSYYYRHPELVETTDTLVGVPTAVVNDIVMQATSIVMMSWDQNYAGSHFGDTAQAQASAKHGTSSGSGAKRHRIGSFESAGSAARMVRGFPNKVLG